jgi:hypothetical protein
VIYLLCICHNTDNICSCIPVRSIRTS